MEAASSPNKKRRIPKACASCRTSKLRCDGGKPCRRCIDRNVYCDYMKPAADPVQEKLAEIESQMEALKSRVPDTTAPAAVTLLELQQMQSRSPLSPVYFNGVNHQIQGSDAQSPMSMGSAPLRNESMSDVASNFGLGKRKRGDFEINVEPRADVVNKGLISYDDAVMYFATFFQGCDKYVPIFDSGDTFESVRSRSSMLFDAICAVGCRAEHGPGSEQFQALSNATKSPICEVLMGTVPKSIETIQALLVNSCYQEKGWLLTSMATRMALDLDLPGLYNKLCTLILADEDSGTEGNDGRSLMRATRVWFGTFVLEHILSLDCGKSPGIKAVNCDGMRRCRVLLGHPARTPLDFRLLAQVELNSIRARAHDRLTPKPGTLINDELMAEIVQEERIDLSVWLSDWSNLVESKVPKEEHASLLINLRIQRDWSEMTMLCKGLQGMGIDNVAIMSDSQRHLIDLARVSAQRHISIILSDPERYLATFRYGMDFVWAKCAFSVLLLLKLARLQPSTDISSMIQDAKTLLSHLSKVRGSSNIYFRILTLSVEKCEKAFDDGEGEMDFQSYVPKEFILEWNFPGLTFCWIPFDFQDLFLDFGNGF